MIRNLMQNLLPAAFLAMAAAPSATALRDSGTFRLYKFAQAIGTESYVIVRAGDSVALTSTFRFVDRGSPVPLATSWRGSGDLTPRFFAIHGQVSRETRIADTVTIAGGMARMRVDGAASSAPVTGRFFTISGYAPVAMQELLLRYWDSNGKPAQPATLPSAHVAITRRGVDTVKVDGPAVLLRRYRVDGLIWGRETLWRTASDELAAVVSIDAEFDHFEATRPDYGGALPFFIATAASDGAVAMAERTRSASAGSGAFALTGGTLIDGTSATPVSDAVIVVRGGKIVAAGPRATMVIPAGAQRIDVTGKYIVPGLWDMHAHYEQVEWGPIHLAAGVSTVRDVGNERAFVTGVRDANASGRGVGPRMLLAGVIDGSGPYALGIEQADTPERGVELVDRYHDAGFQQIKIYSSMKLPVLQAVTAEAHHVGMTVTGHIPNGITTEQGIDAGMDQVNHIQYILPMMMPHVTDTTRTPDFQNVEAQHAIAFLQAHHTVLDPTLDVFEWSLHPAQIPFSEIEPGVLHVAPTLRPLLMNTGVSAAREGAARRQFAAMVAAVGALHRAGITIVAGTDQGVPGFSLHRELELYVQAGFTPLEALQAATIVPVRVMGLDRETGSIAVGKRADLLVVSATPLERIDALRNISLVIAAGRRSDPAPLWRSVGFLP